MKKILLQVLLSFFVSSAVAQNVGVGTATPNASAMLDVTSANKGVLVPRVALLDANDVTTIPAPVVSLLIYNTGIGGLPAVAVSPGYYYWNGSKWVAFIISDNSVKAAWVLGGNGGTNVANNYIGTVDNQALQFKISDTYAGYLGLDGNTYWGYNSGNATSTGFSNVAIGSSAMFRSNNRPNLVAVGDSALYNDGRNATLITEGIHNTAVGSKTLYANTLGSYNTALGYNALMLNSAGVSNTATGDDALLNNSSGNQNTANGKDALVLNSTGSFNSAIGTSGLSKNTSGSNNTAAGSGALLNNTTGYSNVAVGIHALRSNTTKNNLVAVGDSALLNNGTGAIVAIDATANTAIGSKALFANTTGNSNTANGHNSLANNSAGNNNTAIGTGSLLSNTTGFSNTAVGMNAMNKNTSRSNLVALGDSALYNNGTGASQATEATGNTAIGSKSLFTNSKGFFNTAVGFKTMFFNTTGNYNTATGVQALFFDTSGSFNSASGYQALTNNTSGSNNTAAGFQSLLSNTTGTNNTATGASSLVLTSSGINNTANGYLSLFSNSTGSNNTAAGTNSLLSNTTGYSNVGVGIKALYLNTIGNNLAAVGDSALYNNGNGATTGQGKENTAMGSKALISNTIGNSNAAFGANADVAANNLSNATAIGSRSIVNCNNCLVLGSVNGLNGASASVKVGVGTSVPLMGLHVAKPDSAVALFENTQALNPNVSNSLYFKTGIGAAPYTGAIKTIGETNTAARMGLFTYASTSPNQLLERLSITDAGYVGVGTITPLMKLHVVKTDSALALFENSQALNTNVSNALYFKTGNGLLSYTGALKTIGQGTGAARLGLFTYSSATANGLLERLSISDDGNTGIGTITPLMNLHVSSLDSTVALLENTQALNTNISTGLYFKTGNGIFPYTGALKTIGEGTGSARLGFFTSAGSSTSSLKERMSITDAGNVGIGVVAPQADLHINPAGAGSLLIGTNKNAGGYTNIEMGISAQSNGYGYLQATKASGTSYGNLVINESGGQAGIGTSQVNASAKLTVGVNTGVGGNYSGIVATGNGSTSNAAIKAVGTNSADALVVDGPIRALANNGRVIYRMVTQTLVPNTDGYYTAATNSVPNFPDGVITILIDNPLCNGDPNAMIFFSAVGLARPGDQNYQSYLQYGTVSQKWVIRNYYDTNSGATTVSTPPEFNIMIVKP